MFCIRNLVVEKTATGRLSSDSGESGLSGAFASTADSSSLSFGAAGLSEYGSDSSGIFHGELLDISGHKISMDKMYSEVKRNFKC